MRLSPDFVLRTVGPHCLLMRSLSGVTDMRQAYSLSESAAWLYGRCEGEEFEAADLERWLTEEYEVDPQTARGDVAATVAQWLEWGIIQK